MIIINLSGHIVNHGGTMLLPGSNIVDKFDTDHFYIKALVDDGQVKVIKDASKASKADKNEAIKHAPTAAILAKLDAMLKSSEDTVLSRSSKARKAEMDEFDKQIKEAAKEKASREAEV